MLSSPCVATCQSYSRIKIGVESLKSEIHRRPDFSELDNALEEHLFMYVAPFIPVTNNS